jgi:hypothetical protein
VFGKEPRPFRRLTPFALIDNGSEPVKRMEDADRVAICVARLRVFKRSTGCHEERRSPPQTSRVLGLTLENDEISDNVSV